MKIYHRARLECDFYERAHASGACIPRSLGLLENAQLTATYLRCDFCEEKKHCTVSCLELGFTHEQVKYLGALVRQNRVLNQSQAA